MKAAVRLDHSLIALESENELYAMLEIRVPEPPAGQTRPPLSIVLVLDRSGSMAGAKLDVAKRCARWLAERLRPDDRLALVAYDDQVRLLAPLATVERARIARALDRLTPGGMTNLSGGWLKGLEVMRGAPTEGVRKVILLSDGLANVGIVDHHVISELVGSAARDGIGTSTIGFGKDFDEDLLIAMADTGGGNAHYAATLDSAPAIFAQEVDGLARVVAQNVSVEIRPGPSVSRVGVVNDYPPTMVPGGVQVGLGDAYGGERRRLVFELVTHRLPEAGVVQLAEVVLRYVAVGAEIAEHEVRVPVIANLVSANEAAASSPDRAVTEEVFVLKAATARNEAIRLADDGQHDAARRVLRTVASELRSVKAVVEPVQAEALEREAAELDASEALLAPAHYVAHSVNRKQLLYEARQRGRRRE